MIVRAQAILDAIAGFPVNVSIANRVVAAFLPEGVDPETLTNEEKATYYVREMRRMTKWQVLQFEEQAAAETALLAARADVEANVIIGDD
jgi:hypothetical protein